MSSHLLVAADLDRRPCVGLAQSVGTGEGAKTLIIQGGPLSVISVVSPCCEATYRTSTNALRPRKAL